jgi:hypothetical protein
MLPGPSDVVEIARRGACARSKNGKVHALAQIRRRSGGPLRLEAITHPEATDAVALVESNACVARQRDGRVFLLEPGSSNEMARSASAPATLTPLALREPVQLEVGHSIACARFRDGTVRCQLVKPPVSLLGDFSITLAVETTGLFFLDQNDGQEVCVLPAEGGLRCWAVNDGKIGALREPLTEAVTRPTRVFPRAARTGPSN